MEEQNIQNPWKGLQSYQETDIIYGRDEEINSLYTRILYNTQTVVYGKSGIGKSSIINAGIIPRAKFDDMLPVSIRLAHTTSKGEKPSLPYVEQIKQRIIEELKNQGGELEEVVLHDSEHQETLWELLHRHRLWLGQGENKKQVTPLLLFDQFEEIFTLETDPKRVSTFFEELADLFNEIMPDYLSSTHNHEIETPNEEVGLNRQKNIFHKIAKKDAVEHPNYIEKSDFHIVFILREDFLSYLERSTAYIPVMKSNRYALLPINEEQAADIIMLPQKGLVSQSVAELIIQKVADRTDFKLDGIPEIEVDAAILSLYLSRLYSKKRDDETEITKELVTQFSDDIIKDFYEESISGIPNGIIEKIEDELLTCDNRRNNVSRKDLVKTGIPDSILTTLVDEKKLLRQFNYRGDNRIEFMHDLLCPIVNERIEKREEAKRKAIEQQQHEEQQRKLLAEEQRKREQIEAQAKADRERMEEEAREQKRKTRRIVLAFIVSAVIAGMGTAYYYYIYKKVYSSYYRSYELVEGWPKGVGKLSENEIVRYPLYYKLSHKGYGRNRKNTDIEICSSNSMLPQAPRIKHLMNYGEDSYSSLTKEFNQVLSKVKYIHYEAGEKGKINKEVFIGEDNSVLFYANYFHLEAEGQTWVQYVSSHGQSMPICDNGLDRVKLTWIVSNEEKENNKGRISSLMYYDALGAPQPVADGVNGCSITYSEDGLTTYCYVLDEYGRPLNTDNTSYNVIVTRTSQDTVDVQYAYVSTLYDSLTPVTGPYGFWRELHVGNESSIYLLGSDTPVAKRFVTRDSHGNIIQMRKEGALHNVQPAIINYTYSNTGLICSEEKLNLDGTPFNATDSIYLRKWQYDENGENICEEHFNSQNERVYYHIIEKDGNVVRDEIQDWKNDSIPVVIQIDSSFNEYHSVSFFTSNDQPFNKMAFDAKVPFHRMVVKTLQNTKTTCYYTYDTSSNKVCCLPTTKDIFGSVLSYYMKVEEFDEDNNLISYQIFDENERLVKSMMFFYQNGQQIAHAAMGIDGTPVRCPDWEEEGFGYYKLYFVKDFGDDYAGIRAVNEWGNNGMFYDGSSQNKYVMVEYKDYKGWIMKENSNSDDGYYPILKSYKQRTFKKDDQMTNTTIPYIHILDKESPLYDNGNGLKDGDRIIKIGNWNWKQSDDLLSSEWHRLCKTPLNIEVLRPTKDGFEKKTFSMQINDADLELAEYHIFALTQDELEMIKKYTE